MAIRTGGHYIEVPARPSLTVYIYLLHNIDFGSGININIFTSEITQ